MPAEPTLRILRAAATADTVGFWAGPGSITTDATTHLVRFLGAILAGDQDVHPRELNVLGRAVQAALGERPTHADLQVAALEALEMAGDAQALQAFVRTTPAYLAALMEMDRRHGTREAAQVVEALISLGYSVLEADGRAGSEEGAIFRGHVLHLRDALAAAGVADPG